MLVFLQLTDNCKNDRVIKYASIIFSPSFLLIFFFLKSKPQYIPKEKSGNFRKFSQHPFNLCDWMIYHGYAFTYLNNTTLLKEVCQIIKSHIVI